MYISKWFLIHQADEEANSRRGELLHEDGAAMKRMMLNGSLNTLTCMLFLMNFHE